MPSAATSKPTSASDKGRRRFTVDALFTDSRPRAIGVVDLTTAKEIRLDRIAPDPDQPRRTFDPSKLEELATSIGREGVLQPIAVQYDDARDLYMIIHGERRWRAARAAGLTAIPAIVRDVPGERRLIQQLMENIVRDDLNAVDRAAALRVLKTQLDDAPWETVAEAIGIRRSRLFQLLGTEKLPESAREDIRAGRLSEKQSRALQGLLPGHQEALRAAIVADDLPAAEAMRLARSLRAARLPDDVAAATAALATLRTQPSSPATTAPDEIAALIAALAAAASDSGADRAALSRLADAIDAPAYDRDRLQTEIEALVRTLARTPPRELRTSGSAYAPLVALHGALAALLSDH